METNVNTYMKGFKAAAHVIAATDSTVRAAGRGLKATRNVVVYTAVKSTGAVAHGTGTVAIHTTSFFGGVRKAFELRKTITGGVA